MSYNGSGTFQINTSGQPVVTGTVISSTAFNSLTADLATGLSTAITKDGQTTVTANIPMANFKITGLGAATVGTDAVRYSQIQSGTDKLITVTGTDTLTGTMTPALTAYAAGNQFSFVAANTNTGAVTINIDGVGVKSITKNGSTALAAGDLTANSIALIEYDGTRFQFLNVGNVVGPASSTANAIPTFSGTTGKLLQDNTKVKIVSNNITMDGSTSGTLTVAASAVSGTNTLTFPANTGTAILDYSTPAFRNRIINGAMAISQRGTSFTTSSGSAYMVDRWQVGATQVSKITGTQSTTSATGFTYSQSLTVASAFSSGAADLFYLTQGIEGFNIADLGWGTANALPITISFWIRSSLTGTYSAFVRNLARDRSYIATFTINSANTFEQKTVTIPGDTSGTWATDNTEGINFGIDLGSGTNYNGTASTWTGSNVFRTSGSVSWVANSSATLFLTGVQLEKGSTATSFDYRAYGTELALCQRYYIKWTQTANSSWGIFEGWARTTASFRATAPLGIPMRASPTSSYSNVNINDGGAAYTVSSFTDLSTATTFAVQAAATGMTQYRPGSLGSNGSAAYIDASAEL